MFNNSKPCNPISLAYFRTVVLSCAFTRFLHFVCDRKFNNLTSSFLLDLSLKIVKVIEWQVDAKCIRYCSRCVVLIAAMPDCCQG